MLCQFGGPTEDISVEVSNSVNDELLEDICDLHYWVVHFTQLGLQHLHQFIAVLVGVELNGDGEVHERCLVS